MSPHQVQTLDFVRERIAGAGYCPTYREIAAEVGTTPSYAHRLVAELVDAGKLRRRPGARRGLELADRADLRGVPSDALRDELARRGETLGALSREPRAYGRNPGCAADTCGAAVERGHLFCRTHWFALDRDLRDGLLTAHSRARRTRSPADASAYQALLTQARDAIDGGRL
jgi:hypothetical protein